MKSDDAEGVQDEWNIFRRYSDFHDFHMVLLGKVRNSIFYIKIMFYLYFTRGKQM